MPFFSATTDAALNNFLDRSYSDTVYRNHPALGLATHEEVYGDAIKMPVSSAYSGGEASDMPTAITNASNVARKPFLVVPSLKYIIEDVNLAQALYSEDQEQAACDVLTDGMAKCLRAAGDAAEREIWGDGSGTMATIKSNTNPSGSTWVLTLNTVTDAWKFAENQVLVSKASPFAASLDTGTAKVTGTDPIGGTVTVTAIGGWTPANTHVVGLQGVMLASTSVVTFLGISAWNPDANNRPASNDNFLGVNRSTNSAALAGIALNLVGMPIKQAINQLLQALSNVRGVNIDTCFLNWADYGALLDDLGSNRVFITVTGETGMNYDGVQFMGPSGKLNVVPGTFIPKGRVQVGDSSTLKIGAPGQFIQNGAMNGKYLEVPTDDIARIKFRITGSIRITNPAAWGNALI